MLRITKMGNRKLTLMHQRKIVNLQGKIIKQSIKTRVFLLGKWKTLLQALKMQKISFDIIKNEGENEIWH